MGRLRGPGKPDFLRGMRVRVAPRDRVEAVHANWVAHHPVSAARIDLAGRRAVVRKGFAYHGGDELYEIDRAPGMWHAECLDPAVWAIDWRFTSVAAAITAPAFYVGASSLGWTLAAIGRLIGVFRCRSHPTPRPSPARSSASGRPPRPV